MRGRLFIFPCQPWVSSISEWEENSVDATIVITIRRKRESGALCSEVYSPHHILNETKINKIVLRGSCNGCATQFDFKFKTEKRILSV
jgi:hypothetical protein